MICSLQVFKLTDFMLPDRNQKSNTSTRLTLTGHDIHGHLQWQSDQLHQYTSIDQMQNSNVYAAKSMQLAGTLACDQNQYYLCTTSCTGDCRCMDHNTDADMETARYGTGWAKAMYKGAKGAVAGFSAAAKDPKEVLEECKTSLETALAKLNSYHSVHTDASNADEQTIMEAAKKKINEAIAEVVKAESHVKT